MIFKIYDCDFGVKYNGVNYDFTHVQDLQIEDPENTKLVRGANGTSKEGLVYKEGIKDAKKMTVTIMNMTADLKAVLDQAFTNKDRLDAYCISRSDGSAKMAKNAVLSMAPQQLNVNDTPESMNVALVFETFDLSEVHKA